MTNSYGISPKLEEMIRRRDKRCAFCHVKMKRWHSKGPRNNAPAFEHLDNVVSSKDEKNRVNVVMCCTSCNSSKGAKTLRNWFKSAYCNGKNSGKKKINRKTITNSIVKKFMKKNKVK